MAEDERSVGVTLRLDVDERDALQHLLEDMSTLVARGHPNDPAVTRLFPAAFEDEAEARRYRELIGDELKKAKLEAIATVRGGLDRAAEGPLSLSLEEADDWLRVLTDLRLGLGARLGITEEEDPPHPRKGPEAAMFWMMDWLGWLLGTMLEAIEGGRE